MNGADWIAGLPTTAAGFDMMQKNGDALSRELRAVPTRATATAADAATAVETGAVGSSVRELLAAAQAERKVKRSSAQAGSTRC